jgi:hypothetical protein
MTTSTIPTAAKRKEIVRHGPLSLCILSAHRGMGQTEGRKATIPSHLDGGESSRRLCSLVRGRHSRRTCSGV